MKLPRRNLRNDWGKHLYRHGCRYTFEYSTWCKMKARCNNPNAINYSRYGGRGITICERWENSFDNFIDDMGWSPSPDHSIERIKNDLGYFKENCRWATRVEQANNKRNNLMVEFDGRVQTLTLWCRELGLKYHIVRQRIYRNHWTVERAFTTRTTRLV